MNSVQQSIIQQIRQELGETEDTEHLIDWLLDCWETVEILEKRFGETRALQLLAACAPKMQTAGMA